MDCDTCMYHGGDWQDGQHCGTEETGAFSLTGGSLLAEYGEPIEFTITNPGAESSITGWIRITGSLSASTSATEHSGSYSFRGAAPETRYYQDIDVSAIPDDVLGSGEIEFTLSWWECTDTFGGDYAACDLVFLDEADATISTHLGTPLYRVGSGAAQQASLTVAAPAGTRKVRIVQHFELLAGSNINNYIDDIELSCVANAAGVGVWEGLAASHCGAQAEALFWEDPSGLTVEAYEPVAPGYGGDGGDGVGEDYPDIGDPSITDGSPLETTDFACAFVRTLTGLDGYAGNTNTAENDGIPCTSPALSSQNGGLVTLFQSYDYYEYFNVVIENRIDGSDPVPNATRIIIGDVHTGTAREWPYWAPTKLEVRNHWGDLISQKIVRMPHLYTTFYRSGGTVGWALSTVGHLRSDSGSPFFVMRRNTGSRADNDPDLEVSVGYRTAFLRTEGAVPLSWMDCDVVGYDCTLERLMGLVHSADGRSLFVLTRSIGSTHNTSYADSWHRYTINMRSDSSATITHQESGTAPNFIVIEHWYGWDTISSASNPESRCAEPNNRWFWYSNSGHSVGLHGIDAGGVIRFICSDHDGATYPTPEQCCANERMGALAVYGGLVNRHYKQVSHWRRDVLA